MINIVLNINTILWLSVAFILLIGHLTYADYYHDLDEDIMNAYWIAFLIAMVISFIMFCIAGFHEGLYIGWIWFTRVFTSITAIYYVILTIMGICVAYNEAHQYFKNKRGM